MTQETGQRPNGAAAAILAISFPRIDARAHFKRGCLRRFCHHRSFVRLVRASLSPIPHSKPLSSFRAGFFFLCDCEGVNFGAHACQDRLEILEP
jgi:hypothetical protein